MPMSTPTMAAMGRDRNEAQAAAANAATMSVAYGKNCELVVERGEDDAGQAGHEARDRPGRSHHLAGVHPVELHEASALHGASHLEAEVGEAHEDHQGQQDGGGADHRAQVGAAEGRREDVEVDDVRVEEDAGRVVDVLTAEQHRHEDRDAHEEADAEDELGRRVGVRDLAEEEPVEDEPEGGGQDRPPRG